MMLQLQWSKHVSLTSYIHALFESHIPPIKHLFYFTDAKMFTWHCTCYIHCKYKDVT
jgi:hypothetical protein